MQKVRIDKWLWSIRIFKSRSLATAVCKKGGVKIGEGSVKASYLVTVGEEVFVKKEGFLLHLKVVKLLEKRVGAPTAITCYENLTSEEEMNKFNDWFVGKAKPEIRERGTGRPTKRARRDIDKWKIDYLDED